MKDERFREVRIALVLYGGVSLAIYENGVTRCFYDLVKERGIFKVLLELLGAKAVVDVIAGTSAGGINGLFLGAALESGQDFQQIAELWRKLGDIQKLLRKSKDAKDAESLLDGNFFLRELEEAFARLVTPKERGFVYPSEMDIFITGTDIDGHRKRYMDSQGRVIDDKEHRVVFHLQHRPERKWLGLVQEKDTNDVNVPRVHEPMDVTSSLTKQAKTLAAIARITAGFPLGFEPIQGGSLPPYVQEALGYCEEGWSYGHPQSKDGYSLKNHSFVDGGVLDNKPFGPALRAIFHRMPGGAVNRRLFYVEPDPEPFVEEKDHKNPPVTVGYKALISIPGYEGIGDDLESLIEHNQRVQWLKYLRDIIGKKPEENPGATALYVRTRVECLCRSLILEGNPVPAAKDYPADPARRVLFGYLINELKDRVETERINIDSYDVIFHIRKAFYFLYALHGILEGNPGNGKCKEALRLTGRIVKTLKVVMSMLAEKRKEIIDSVFGEKDPATIQQEDAEYMLDRFSSFLHKGGDHWGPILNDLARYRGISDGQQDDFLKSKHLAEVIGRIRAIGVEELKVDRKENKAEPLETILDKIGEAIDCVIDDYNEAAHQGAIIMKNSFLAVDCQLYPLEFISGIYELDEITFTRISPRDAQVGLSEGKQCSKIAGDQLAHFSAFLRRDWRSSDILQGRLDGVCQIIESLLNDGEIERLLRGKVDVMATLENNRLNECRDDTWMNLAKAWEDLSKEWNAKTMWGDTLKSLAGDFRRQLILSGQEQAFFEDIGTILEDVRYQEIKFGKSIGPLGAVADTNDTTIELDARVASGVEMNILNKDEKLKLYQDMEIGSQKIIGEQGQVPNVVIGEYISTAWLMVWGMLRQTNGRIRGFMDKRTVKLLSYWPARLFRRVCAASRWDKSLILYLVVFVMGGLAGCLATYYVYARVNVWWAWAALAVVCAGVVLCLLVLVTKMRADTKKKKPGPMTGQKPLFCQLCIFDKGKEENREVH